MCLRFVFLVEHSSHSVTTRRHTSGRCIWNYEPGDRNHNLACFQQPRPAPRRSRTRPAPPLCLHPLWFPLQKYGDVRRCDHFPRNKSDKVGQPEAPSSSSAPTTDMHPRLWADSYAARQHLRLRSYLNHRHRDLGTGYYEQRERTRRRASSHVRSLEPRPGPVPVATRPRRPAPLVTLATSAPGHRPSLPLPPTRPRTRMITKCRWSTN